MSSYNLPATMSQDLLPSSNAEHLTSQCVGNHDMPSIGYGAAIAKLIDEDLGKDPSYRSPVGLHNQLIPQPTDLSLRFSMTTSFGIHGRTPFIPLPIAPTPKEPPLFQYFTGHPYDELASDVGVSNRRDGLCDIQSPPQSREAPQVTYQDALSVVVDGKVAETSIHECEVLVAPAKTKRRNCIKCSNCSFARINGDECEGFPGEPCTRCTNHLFQLRTSLKSSGESPIFINEVLIFDLKETQIVLSKLRGEAQSVLDLNTGITQEDYFLHGSIICHMASSDNVDVSLVKDSVQVVIKSLATTHKAASLAADCQLEFPNPGLDGRQMDSFIKIQNRMCGLESLTPAEKDIISAALKISDHVGILFNWDNNRICIDDTSKNYAQQDTRNATLVLAKNIVLETVYSFVHRVQDLMKMICFQLNRSFLQPPDPNHDPATIPCALWIMYASLKSFRKLPLKDTNLKHLNNFLNEMRERAGGAITAIERYRKESAFASCGRTSPNHSAFQKLVVAKKVPQEAITFSYEQVDSAAINFRLPTYSSQQSYTQVLESCIIGADFLGALYFSEAGDRYEVTSPGTKVTLAQLRERDRDPGRKMEPDTSSTISTTSNTSFASQDGSEAIEISDPLELSNPSLRRYEIYLGSKFELDAEIRRTKERLHFLEQVKSASRYNPAPIPSDPGTHQDWIAPDFDPHDCLSFINEADVLPHSQTGISTSMQTPSSPGNELRKKRKRDLSLYETNNVLTASELQKSALAPVHQLNAAKQLRSQESTKTPDKLTVSNEPMMSMRDETGLEFYL